MLCLSAHDLPKCDVAETHGFASPPREQLHEPSSLGSEAGAAAVATRSRASQRRRISEDRAPIGTALPIGEARGSLATMRSYSAIAFLLLCSGPRLAAQTPAPVSTTPRLSGYEIGRASCRERV